MKKDKCASCGKKDGLKAEIFHSDQTDSNYRIMVCEDCANRLGATLKVTPTYCPACGKKLDELDLDYQSDNDEMDYEIAAQMGIDEEHADWDSRFVYVYSMMDCPTCGFYASHGEKWYYNSATNCYDLPKPEGAPMTPDEERRIAEAAGQLDMFAGQ